MSITRTISICFRLEFIAAGIMLFGRFHPGMEILTTALGGFLMFISVSHESHHNNT